MRKNQKNYKRKLKNGMIASLYIAEKLLSKDFTVEYNGDSITTNYYEEIGAVVGRSSRQCNDWYNGDKNGNGLRNKMTGTGAEGFLTIVSMLTDHVSTFINTYGYYCCLIDGTDDKRVKTYIKAMYHYCNKKNLYLRVVSTNDGLLCWIQ